MGVECPRPQPDEGVAAFTFPSPEVTQCPYGFYEALRRDAPVYKHPERNEYLVARRKDILHVFQHPEIFSNDLAVGDERFRQEVADFAGTSGNGEEAEGPILTARSLVFSDPPDHTVKRRALARVVARERMRRVRAARGRDRERADRHVPARRRGRVPVAVRRSGSRSNDLCGCRVPGRGSDARDAVGADGVIARTPLHDPRAAGGAGSLARRSGRVHGGADR